MVLTRRFTLVELMIVVAIIGILAAIAIPNFAQMQLRAKKAEVLVNLPALADAVRAYESANDQWPAGVADHPRTVPNKQLAEWTLPSGFEALGWAPDGAVRATYSIYLNPTTCTGGDALAPDAYAQSDLDGDGNPAPRICCADGTMVMYVEEPAGNCASKFGDRI